MYSSHRATGSVVCIGNAGIRLDIIVIVILYIGSIVEETD